jgi:hypothetical protein
MRTVKVAYKIDAGSGNRMTIETEVIVDNDTQAEEAGKEAAIFIARFSEGMTQAITE